MVRQFKILYRESEITQEELVAASEFFPCTPSRMLIQAGDLIIGRYSVLPFYAEQEQDIRLVGAELINTTRAHNWIADVGSWASGCLEGLTPRTWTHIEEIPDGISLVLKGQTNSKKFNWNSHMFAANKAEAIQVYLRLLDDTLIGQQTIYFREYIPLMRLGTGLHGLPISKEFRFFVCDGEVLCGGFYWASHAEEVPVPRVAEVPEGFLQKVVKRVAERARFVVVDVAQTASGDWIVIELNDGQMSGLALCDPTVLYHNLRRILDRAKNA